MDAEDEPILKDAAQALSHAVSDAEHGKPVDGAASQRLLLPLAKLVLHHHAAMISALLFDGFTNMSAWAVSRTVLTAEAAGTSQKACDKHVPDIYMYINLFVCIYLLIFTLYQLYTSCFSALC